MENANVNLKESMLLINSKIINDYPWFEELLIRNKKLLKKDIKYLPESQRNFFRDMYDSVLKQAIDEWKPINEDFVEDKGPNKRDWMPCSLCHQPNRYIYYIYNVFNGKTLNIGSECVKEFFDLAWVDIPISKLIAKAKILRRENQLNEHFLGIIQKLSSWSLELEKQPIIIPIQMESQYLQIGDQIKELCKLYLDSKEEEKEDNEIITNISELLNEAEDVHKDIEKYVINHSNDKYIPTKDVRIWLKLNRDDDTIDMLKREGKITWKTIHRIAEPQFMKFVASDFNNYLKNINIQIVEVNFDKKGYMLNVLPFDKIRFFITHKELTLYFAGVLFKEEPIEPFKTYNILHKCKIFDNNSAELLTSELKDRIKNAGISIRNFDSEFDEITVYEKTSDKYVRFELSSFVDNFKELALGLGPQKVEDVVSYINNLKEPRYTLDRIREFEQMRKESKSL